MTTELHHEITFDGDDLCERYRIEEHDLELVCDVPCQLCATGVLATVASGAGPERMNPSDDSTRAGLQ